MWEVLSQLHRTSATQVFLAGIVLCNWGYCTYIWYTTEFLNHLCNHFWPHSIRVASLPNEAARESFLMWYEKWFENAKRDLQIVRNMSEMFLVSLLPLKRHFSWTFSPPKMSTIYTCTCAGKLLACPLFGLFESYSFFHRFVKISFLQQPEANWKLLVWPLFGSILDPPKWTN